MIAKIFAGTRFTIHAAYVYSGVHFCDLEPGEKTIAIDMSIEGMNTQIELDTVQILDPETGEDINANCSFVNYVLLDPKTGRLCEPALDPVPRVIRMLLIYNVSEKIDSFKLSILEHVITPEAVPIRSSVPLDAPQPTESDFDKADAALKKQFGEPTQNELAAHKP